MLSGSCEYRAKGGVRRCRSLARHGSFRVEVRSERTGASTGAKARGVALRSVGGEEKEGPDSASRALRPCGDRRALVTASACPAHSNSTGVGRHLER
jgi:hypothetical protein